MEYLVIIMMQLLCCGFALSMYFYLEIFPKSLIIFLKSVEYLDFLELFPKEIIVCPLGGITVDTSHTSRTLLVTEADQRFYLKFSTISFFPNVRPPPILRSRQAHVCREIRANCLPVRRPWWPDMALKPFTGRSSVQGWSFRRTFFFWTALPKTKHGAWRWWEHYPFPCVSTVCLNIWSRESCLCLVSVVDLSALNCLLSALW